MALDSGAKRMGVSVLDFNDGGISYIFSLILGKERGNTETYQEYRMALIEYFVIEATSLLNRFNPDVVVSEIIPVAGSSVSSAQRQLAATAVTAFQATAIGMGVRCEQIAASTVKKKLTGSGRASKAVVRKAVIAQLPELKEKLTANKAVSDESDALAIGIIYGQY